MDAILDIYGKTIISCFVAAAVLLTSFSMVNSFYEKAYPEHHSESITDIYKDSIDHCSPPIIESVERVKIRRDSAEYDAMSCIDDEEQHNNIRENYKNLINAKAYESNWDSSEIEVSVYGVDRVDVSAVGQSFNVTLKATNSNGHTTTKTVKIFIN